jgi:pre-rRNA-processing protein TSR4
LLCFVSWLLKLCASSTAAGPFGLGSHIFGAESGSEQSFSGFGAPEEEESEAKASDEHDNSDSDLGEEDSDDELVTAMATATLKDSPWASAPRYSPLYMSTTAEYLPPAPKSSIPVVEEVLEDNGNEKKSKETTWALEGYENSLDIDHAFERFSKRIGYEAEQCIRYVSLYATYCCAYKRRYELGGAPLPFASDEVFDRLFPKPATPTVPVTKPNSMITPVAKRIYSTSSIAACPHCKGKRVFEFQLMPNLINILKDSARGPEKHQTDEERRKEVERVLKGEKSVDRTGMGWGTCMVFSCEKDCLEENVKDGWREELVLVQWDR